MNDELTAEGYEQTREKFRSLQRRLAEFEARPDLSPSHRTRVFKSYNTMMRKYLREIKLYESRREAR